MTKSRKVLQLRSSPFLGSPEKMILGRSESLIRTDWQYCVGIFDEQWGELNDFARKLDKLGITAIRFDPSMRRWQHTLSRLVTIVKRKKIALICSNDYKSNFYAFLIGKIVKVPIISVFHGRTSFDKKVRLYEAIDEIILRFFDAVVAVSENTRARLEALHISPASIYVIPNAVETHSKDTYHRMQPSIRREFNLPSRQGLVVFAGRLSKEKGLIFLIQAARIIVLDKVQVKFALVGDGPERSRLEWLIRSLGLEHHILMPGFRNDIGRFLRAMSFMVLPSLTEGMPMVILEAFAEGKPVVASRVGGIPEIVSHGFNGLLVSPANVPQLAAAITFLIRNNRIATMMGRNGLKTVSQNHTFSAQARAYVHMYTEVLRDYHSN